MDPGIDRVRNIVLILSGKGGVGKSTVATQLAYGLWLNGLKVGVLDIDLCGPSLPRMFGLQNQTVYQSAVGWQPVYVDASMASQRLGVMSIGFLLPNEDDPVIWRGPKKHSMINQLIDSVQWGDLDCLLIDTPPGVSDEHMSVIEKLLGHPRYVKRATPPQESSNDMDSLFTLHAIIVTTPQKLALSDVRRQMNMCATRDVKILGLVENMSGYTCTHCKQTTKIFSVGGGVALAHLKDVPVLGQLPFEPRLVTSCDSSEDFLSSASGLLTSELREMVENVKSKLLL